MAIPFNLLGSEHAALDLPRKKHKTKRKRASSRCAWLLKKPGTGGDAFVLVDWLYPPLSGAGRVTFVGLVRVIAKSVPDGVGCLPVRR
jgi:hypothetical protein